MSDPDNIKNETPRQATARKEHDRKEALNNFRTSGWGIGLFYGYLVAILIATSLVGKVIIDNRHISKESHRGLCALKAERVRRYEQTKEILDKPNDPQNAKIIASFGRPLLVRSLASAKADADALKDVDC